MRPVSPSPHSFSETVSGPTCDDCYFRRQGLCALAAERPCPTFRADARTLRPPRRPRLVARLAV